MYLVLSSAQAKKAAGVFSGCLGIQPHAHTLHGAPFEPRDLHLRDVQELGRALLRQAVIKPQRDHLLLPLRQAAQRRTETDAITLATMHSAKGLEFPIVYILDANEGITPHSRAMLDEDMEEERRLFYVAMTRAKTRLHVYAVRERYHKKAEVSRFVWEYLGRDGDSR